jgi:hypothetical protein
MSIPSYWEAIWASRRSRNFLRAMAVLNLGFSGACLFLWAVVALILAEPISWATLTHLGITASRPALLEYPYMMLWLMPLVATGAASVSEIVGYRKLANVTAVFPLLLFTLTVCWWNLFGTTYQ